MHVARLGLNSLNFNFVCINRERRESGATTQRNRVSQENMELDNILVQFQMRNNFLGNSNAAIAFFALSSFCVFFCSLDLSKSYSPATTLKIQNNSFSCNETAELVLTSECPSVLKTNSAPEVLGNVLKRNLFKDYEISKVGGICLRLLSAKIL